MIPIFLEPLNFKNIAFKTFAKGIVDYIYKGRATSSRDYDALAIRTEHFLRSALLQVTHTNAQ